MSVAAVLRLTRKTDAVRSPADRSAPSTFTSTGRRRLVITCQCACSWNRHRTHSRVDLRISVSQDRFRCPSSWAVRAWMTGTNLSASYQGGWIRHTQSVGK
jgi:hypothetical protein